MSLAAILLILAALATAEAVASLFRPNSRVELSVMAAILMIAAALILLDMASTVIVTSALPVG